jgi:hypothetical protein
MNYLERSPLFYLKVRSCFVHMRSLLWAQAYSDAPNVQARSKLIATETCVGTPGHTASAVRNIEG